MTTIPTAAPIPRDLGTPIYDRLEAEYSRRRHPAARPPAAPATAHFEITPDGHATQLAPLVSGLVAQLAVADDEQTRAFREPRELTPADLADAFGVPLSVLGLTPEEPATAEFPALTPNPWFTRDTDKATT
ncbi:hypothetical protein GCM10022252_76270 [Streptosporangium oxazolinicum]|uniref:Uncharacterized protein n=1 Tax=Streptosporangium oxazolinicum TaxID=909287 RepID=A0ABP8BL69_9ACTN